MPLKKEGRLKPQECYLLIAGMREPERIHLGTADGEGIPTTPCCPSVISNKFETQTAGLSGCIWTYYGHCHYQLRRVLDALSLLWCEGNKTGDVPVSGEDWWETAVAWQFSSVCVCKCTLDSNIYVGRSFTHTSRWKAADHNGRLVIHVVQPQALKKKV